MKHRNKILFIHNTLPEYRIQFFCELVNFLDLTLLITDKGLASSIYKLDSIVPSCLKVIYLKKTNEIKEIIVSNCWDIVVLPPIDNFYQLKSAIKALKICKTKNIKTVYWTEKWEPANIFQPFVKKIKNKVQAFLIGYLANNVDLCIAAGEMSKRYYLANGISSAKIMIAIDSSTSPDVPEKIDIRSLYNIPKESNIILFLSRVVKRKGADILFKAVSLLNDQNNYLLICGEGDYLDKVKEMSKSLLRTNVIFTGKIQPNQRAAYFAQSDVFVLPSYTCEGVIEAWGLTCNEALEQGTPVIATTAVGAAHDLADGKCCLMVEENNVEALAEALRQILSEENLEKCCKERYALFSVRQMAESFYKAFNSIM